MKNILCKLATSIVFILQITNINLVNSANCDAAQTCSNSNADCYAAQTCSNSNYDINSLVNIEKSSIINDNNNIINTNEIRFDSDNENYLKLALSYLNNSMIENDNNIKQSQYFISNYLQNNEKLSDKIDINKILDLSYKKCELKIPEFKFNLNSCNFDYHAGTSGSDGIPLESSKSIREAWINCHHESYGTSSSVGDKKKTCFDCLTNIFNKVKSCIVPSNNNDEYNQINNDDNNEDNQKVTYLDLYDKADQIIEYNMNKVREEYKANSNKKTCYDFFNDMFNKVTSYIMPSNNNTLYGEVVDEIKLIGKNVETDLYVKNVDKINLRPIITIDNNIDSNQETLGK